jgi:acetolactate synthase-1/2/3 large subunit
MKYAEYLLENLAKKENYSHCYFVAGGNTMHLLDAARKIFKCVPVVNEVAAGIAAEYFNEANKEGKKAFALVTAGPGLTNIVTAIAGAYLESRELLVIGGQVKTSDLKSSTMRQRGIQEIDGRAIVEPITVSSRLIDAQVSFSSIQDFLNSSKRPGPVFLEIPLDVQGSSLDHTVEATQDAAKGPETLAAEEVDLDQLLNDLKLSKRPVLLIGGGVSRKLARKLNKDLQQCGIPIMTTWNGMDRYGSDLPNYWGRPNTWGQRSANILLQQSDLLIAVGSRLGLQQTGFAWEEFAPLANIYQVDIDREELEKGHPKIMQGIQADADKFLESLLKQSRNIEFNIDAWLSFGEIVQMAFPLNDAGNVTASGFISPFHLMDELSNQLASTDVVIPCSSGGAFTVTMQAFSPKYGQTIVTNKGLASMGYGLSGAIGAAESTQSRTILIEGDGGFAQNLQELGTVAAQRLNVKVFVFSNSGYASIRMTQKNYFAGAYLGCDIETGLGLPDWKHIAAAYGLKYLRLTSPESLKQDLGQILEENGPCFVEVKIDPDQTYFPKITSRILPNGTMASNPLHLMSPDLSEHEITEYLPHLASIIFGNR